MKGTLIAFIACLFLQLCVGKPHSETQLYEGCRVKETNVLYFRFPEDKSFSIAFFIAESDNITIQVSFLGQEDNQYNDLFILNPGSGKLQRKRNADGSDHEITPLKKIKAGWNSINITLLSKQLLIGDHYTLEGFEYDICEVSFMAKYLTNCTNQTPVLNITEYKVSSIPLIGLMDLNIRLYSENPFHPELVLNTLNIPLNYDEELVIRKSSDPLPPKMYEIIAIDKDDMILLYAINEEGQNKLILMANIKEDIRSLNISSLKGSFDLILDPFFEYHDNSSRQAPKQRPTQPPTQPTQPPKRPTQPPTQGPNPRNDASCNLQWIIIAGLTLTILILTAILIWPCIKQRNKHNNKDAENGNAEELVLLKKESEIKFEIKSNYTEPHGEVNPEMSQHSEKEICEIKMKSDKKNNSKKKLGSLNSNRVTKVIIVVGQTGSGKSSFINAMVNYIYGIDYDDPFRFKLINILDEANRFGTNSTNDITAYHIPYMPGIKNNWNYVFIDTPGFGDARGLAEDNKWNQRFKEFFTKNPDITEVDGICCVIKASDTRLTFVKNYIINGLFSIFGKDIKNNIYAVVSYSDGARTDVPKLLQERGLHYNMVIKFNSKGLYNDTETSHSEEIRNRYFKSQWSMTMEQMDSFFNKLMGNSKVSLCLTNVVLEENEDINNVRDIILDLIVEEDDTTGQERRNIQSRIQEKQELLMEKIGQAQKLSGRLKNIQYRKNPLAINEYIDILIENEKDEKKKAELEKLKNRNTEFQKVLEEAKKYH